MDILPDMVYQIAFMNIPNKEYISEINIGNLKKSIKWLIIKIVNNIIIVSEKERICMSIEKQRVIETLENLPEELTNKIIDYIEYLKFEYVNSKAPENLIIKNEEDLKNKLLAGLDDIENGRVYTLEQVFDELQMILK